MEQCSDVCSCTALLHAQACMTGQTLARPITFDAHNLDVTKTLAFAMQHLIHAGKRFQIGWPVPERVLVLRDSFCGQRHITRAQRNDIHLHGFSHAHACMIQGDLITGAASL